MHNLFGMVPEKLENCLEEGGQFIHEACEKFTVLGASKSESSILDTAMKIMAKSWLKCILSLWREIH